MEETWVWSLGQEDPLEKETATHSSILAWRIPWTVEPGGLQSMGSQKSQTQFSDYTTFEGHRGFLHLVWMQEFFNFYRTSRVCKLFIPPSLTPDLTYGLRRTTSLNYRRCKYTVGSENLSWSFYSWRRNEPFDSWEWFMATGDLRLGFLGLERIWAGHSFLSFHCLPLQLNSLPSLQLNREASGS